MPDRGDLKIRTQSNKAEILMALANLEEQARSMYYECADRFKQAKGILDAVVTLKEEVEKHEKLDNCIVPDSLKYLISGMSESSS